MNLIEIYSVNQHKKKLKISIHINGFCLSCWSDEEQNWSNKRDSICYRLGITSDEYLKIVGKFANRRWREDYVTTYSNDIYVNAAMIELLEYSYNKGVKYG